MLNVMTRFTNSLLLATNLDGFLSGKNPDEGKFKLGRNSKIRNPNKTVFKKFWYKSSEALTRKPSDEIPFLNQHISIDKLSTKSSIIDDEMFDKRSNKTYSRETKTNKQARYHNTNLTFKIDASATEEHVSQFNYKSYPLSSAQILNWMNMAWSEYEIEENDFSKCTIMDLQGKGGFETDKKVITPFHSLAAPKISIGDYYMNRIVKFVSLTPVDFCIMVILIRRAVKKLNGILKITTLTAHRLVLAAALLTYKLMYDVQYGIKFWAHIGGVPQWEMVMLEYHLLKILNWDLCVGYSEFKKTYIEILSNNALNMNVSIHKRNHEFNFTGNQKKSYKKFKAGCNNKHTILQINTSRPNSNRKKY